nr:unnamed protein product [Callosobruchus chinensis]CAH7761720.1 unnamed protein product [Callosobruchus chinensis]
MRPLIVEAVPDKLISTDPQHLIFCLPHHENLQ